MKKLILIAFALTVAIFAAALGGLWLFGHREGGNHAGASIQIDRPAVAIWPYLAQPDQLKRWNSGITEITRLSGNGAAVGARSRVVAQGRPGETPVTMEHTFTAVDLNKRLAFKLTANLDGMGFTQKVEQRLDEKNGGTMVTLNADVEFQGFVAQLFSPLIIASASDKTVHDLRTLKTLVEQEVPATVPAPTANAPAPSAEPEPAEAAAQAQAVPPPAAPNPATAAPGPAPIEQPVPARAVAPAAAAVPDEAAHKTGEAAAAPAHVTPPAPDDTAEAAAPAP